MKQSRLLMIVVYSLQLNGETNVTVTITLRTDHSYFFFPFVPLIGKNKRFISTY